MSETEAEKYYRKMRNITLGTAMSPAIISVTGAVCESSKTSLKIFSKKKDGIKGHYITCSADLITSHPSLQRKLLKESGLC